MHVATDTEPLFCSADALRWSESDAGDTPWWTGYMRGLRWAQGSGFGTQAEHDLLVAAIGSPDAYRNALANGYKAGLTRLFHAADATT